MGILPTCLAAALALGVVAKLVVPAGAVSCTGGKGDDRWCTRGEKDSPAAHKTESCPEVCHTKTCEDVRPAKGERRGIFLEHGDDDDDDDDDMGSGKNWEDIARSGLYEHIYAVDDKYVCLTSCWYQPWKAKCDRWEEAFGRKYCLNVNCEHDTYGEKGGNRTSGCHTDTDGNLKLDWHKPTCNECIQLFPACYDELKSFADREDHSAAELLEASVEAEAKQQCKDKYFQAPGSMASPGRRLMSDDDDDDDDSGDDDSDSSEEGRSGPPKGLIGPSWPSQVKIYAKETVETMLANGTLSCPPAQCLTDDLQLFASRFGSLEPTTAPTPAPTPPLTGPWYHSISEGYCAWSCDGSPSNSLWCNKNVENCMACKSTWCPPSEALPWDPVTPATYEPKPEWYESTTEGFCAFNTNCNEQYQVEDPWCQWSVDNCLVCAGAWCPPKAMSGSWQPVSKPKPAAPEMPTDGPAMATDTASTDQAEMPLATEAAAVPAELAELPVATEEAVTAAAPAQMGEIEEMPMPPAPADAQEIPMAMEESSMAPAPAEMEEMPMPVEAAMAPAPADAQEMPMAMEDDSMAPAPAEMAEMEEMPEATEEAGIATAPLAMEEMLTATTAVAPPSAEMADMEEIPKATNAAGPAPAEMAEMEEMLTATTAVASASAEMAEMEEIPMATNAVAPSSAEMADMEEIPMATNAVAPAPADMADMEEIPMATNAVAPAPAEMAETEEVPVVTEEAATAAAPADMEEMPTATSIIASAPADMAEIPMATEEAAIAPGPSGLFVEDMETVAGAPGPVGMSRKMLFFGSDERFFQALRTFADKSQCPVKIVDKDIKVQDFLLGQ